MLKVVALLAALPQVLGAIRCGPHHEDPPFWCGDGVVDRGEACDDGAANSDTLPNACRTNCWPARCGDGVLDHGEACDPPDGLACTEGCQRQGYCGDGVVQAELWEACDDGNTLDGDGCSAQCLSETCGDGVQDPWEACDDGNLRTADGCSSGCTTELLWWTGDATPLAGRTLHAATWDASRLRLVVFGGTDDASLLDDVLESDGGPFSQHAPTPRPEARTGAAFAFHPGLGGALLLGGMGAGGVVLGDEWHWDGADWQPLSPSLQPPPRAGAAMVYDGSRGLILLFGGTDGAVLGDTWERTESTWVEHTEGPSPPPRQRAAATYDAAIGGVLLFGGNDGAWLADTWVRDASGWRAVALAEPPPALEDVGLFHHRPSGASYLVGSTPPGTLGLWRFAGDRWEPVTRPQVPALPFSPEGRRSFAVGLFPPRAEAWVIGGRDDASALPAEVRRLGFVRQWLAELCVPGADTDQDGLMGCDDPDCAFTPACP